MIVKHLLAFREEADPRHEQALPLSRARDRVAPGRYDALLDQVEWALVHMPLPRVQFIGREEDRFLYEYNFTRDTPKGVVDRYQRCELGRFDNRLTLCPGVGAALIALNGVLRPLIHRAWTTMVAQMNRLEQSRLEDFLFGKERVSLKPVQPDLLALQGGRCFYCGKGVTSACDVDHFVPWARHADNSIAVKSARRSTRRRSRSQISTDGHVVCERTPEGARSLPLPARQVGRSWAMDSDGARFRSSQGACFSNKKRSQGRKGRQGRTKKSQRAAKNSEFDAKAQGRRKDAKKKRDFDFLAFLRLCAFAPLR